MSTVCDSSPLIGLNAIGRLDLIPSLFGNVLIPSAVEKEIQRFPLPAWITVTPLPDSASGKSLRHDLGLGESEAISLCLYLRAERIVLDDAAARFVAKNKGLRVIGVLGILLSAKRLGILTAIRSDLEVLRAASFHISPRVFREILARAGEL